jgi:hypothetical protein
MSRRLAVLAVLALGPIAACGSKSTATVDAAHPGDGATTDGATIDAAAIDAAAVDGAVVDANPFAGCDWVQTDHTNTLETVTGFTGATFTICGQLDLVNGSGTPTQYVRSFGLVSATTTDVAIRLDTAQPIDGFSYVDLADVGRDSSRVIKSHGVVTATLKGGGQADTLSITSVTPTSVTTAIAFKLTISPLPAAQICPTFATVDYTEAHDGASSNANDTLRITASGFSTTGGTAEPTGLTLASGSMHRLHGTSGAVTPDTFGFNDVDAYAVTTGADTNELAVRLDWTGTPPDMAFAVAATDLSAWYLTNVGSPARIGLIAVAPATTYWIWAAANTAGTNGLPLPYDVSLCAAHVAAP